MNTSGIGGSLLPLGYLETCLADDVRAVGTDALTVSAARRLERVWRDAERTVGPATGIRAVVDLLADPFFSALGFTLRAMTFHHRRAHLELRALDGSSIAALVLPWSHAPSSAWRDLVAMARELGASWGLVLAPPFLSLVPTSRSAVQHTSIDFDLSEVVSSSSRDVLWALASANAVTPTPTGEPPVAALVQRAERFQQAVRTDLQAGVHDAMASLAKAVTHDRLSGRTRGPTRRSGADEALTMIYRVLFLLFAESRRMTPVGHPIYDAAYSMHTLASTALAGDAVGTWEALAAISRLARRGCRSSVLSTSAFGGDLFARSAAPSLEQRRGRSGRDRISKQRDHACGEALVALGSRTTPLGRQPISYQDLGVEQLGAVYERLLDIPPDPALHDHGRPPARAAHQARERKQSGTFYTPQALAEFIVRRTLAPLVEGASADAILSLRILDPSMGSGAMLVAACRYLAEAYGHALVEEGRLDAEALRENERANLRRLVAERCLAGVDRNATAVEIARLSLWLTTLAHDKPLAFLDHRLRVGDSLIGAWPDDLKRVDHTKRSGPRSPTLFDGIELTQAVKRTVAPWLTLLQRHDDSLADIEAKAAGWRRLSSRQSPVAAWRRALDLWCARWFWPAEDRAPNTAEFRALIASLLSGDCTLPPELVADRLLMSEHSRQSHAFFHWPLEFVDVFYDEAGCWREHAGFDAVIGNPPWEMLRGQRTDTGAPHNALVRYVRESGQYPSCSRGHLNLYQAFLDRAIGLTRPGGRIGLVMPWGIATDDGARPLRDRLLEECGLDTVVGLDNRLGLFPIHRGLRFAITTATKGRRTSEIRMRLGVTNLDDVEQLPARDDPLATSYPVRMTRARLAKVGGPMLRWPDARHPHDLPLLTQLVERHLPLHHADGWGVTFGRELNATEARPLLGASGLMVLDGKHVRPFVVGNSSTRISRAQALRALPKAPFDRPRLAYRDVSGVGNAQALIAAVIPRGIVTTHTLFCSKEPLPEARLHALSAYFNSSTMNFITRLLMGGHVTTSLVEHLPTPAWAGDATDAQMANVATRVAGGTATTAARAWLDAITAHRFGLARADLEHVLERSGPAEGCSAHEVLASFDHIAAGADGPAPECRLGSNDPLPAQSSA